MVFMHMTCMYWTFKLKKTHNKKPLIPLKQGIIFYCIISIYEYKIRYILAKCMFDIIVHHEMYITLVNIKTDRKQ